MHCLSHFIFWDLYINLVKVELWLGGLRFSSPVGTRTTGIEGNKSCGQKLVNEGPMARLMDAEAEPMVKCHPLVSALPLLTFLPTVIVSWWFWHGHYC